MNETIMLTQYSFLSLLKSCIPNFHQSIRLGQNWGKIKENIKYYVFDKVVYTKFIPQLHSII